MVVRTQSSFFSRFKIDFAILVLLGLVGLGAWLNNHPFSFEAEDPESAGGIPPQLGHGDVLLVVPSGQDRDDATEFAEMDFSFAWYNALAQEVGPFRLQVTTEFAPEDLDGVHLLVVPTKAAALLETTQISLIHHFVQSGGSLIIEMPGPAWMELTTISEPVLLGRSAKRITAANGSLLQGDFGQHLLDTPLHVKMMRLDTIDLPVIHRNDVLLEIDGVPAHFHRPLGDGHVYLVGFDFGMAVTALQQGRPEDDLTIAVPVDGGPDEDHEPDEDEEPETTRPDMLVASPKMRQSSIPYADLLERHVLYAPLRSRPAVRLWLYPESLAGAFVMTHDERGFGDGAAFMAEYEASLGLTSTYFVTATEMTNEGLDALRRHGVDMGLAWHRQESDPIYQARGVGRLKPYRTALSLGEQKDRLEGWAGRRAYATRVHGLVWDRHYASNFRKMAWAGLHMDSSYGPSVSEECGYLFGTGLPFYVMDVNGLLLPLYEIPVVVSDAVGFGPEDKNVITTLLKESRSGFHQLITVDIDADAMANNPQPATLNMWIEAFESARSERHWVTNLHEYMLFYDARRQATVNSSFDRERRVLTARVEIPAMLSPRNESPMPAPGMTVPMRFEGAAIENVVLDGAPLELSNMGRSGDGVLGLIAIKPGVHRLEVRYADI